MLFLVISGFADINFLVRGKIAWSTFVVACEEHHKAAIHHFIDGVITVLPCLDNFTIIEVPIKAVDSLLWTIIPACIDPLLSICVLPCPVDLSHNGLGKIVGILNMHPVAC